MSNIIFTGGGTAGHVTPNVAIIDELKGKHKIYYIGSKNSIEENIIKKQGIEYYGIASGKLRRYRSRENFIDIFKVIKGTFQALGLMFKLKPSLVFSKGGFVTSPVVWAAWLTRTPVIIHESDISPGLANRLSLPFAKKICYTFSETKAYLKADKAVETGMPIRKNILNGSGEVGRKLCDFSTEKPVLLVVGGSLGSRNINGQVRANLDALLERYQICHICGKGGIDVSLVQKPGYKQFEYVSEGISDLLNMADVIISRAGATFIFEILSLKKPNILVPLSEKVSRGDQVLNAKSFKDAGYSAVVSDEELDKVNLAELVNKVYDDRQDYMSAMEKATGKSGTKKIVNLIHKTMKQKKNR